MRAVPEISEREIRRGITKYMPSFVQIPDRFKGIGDPYVKFISGWFFNGLKDQDIEKLKPRDGVNKKQAMLAVAAIMRSCEPKHEHKEAACSYLLHEWFELDGAQ